MKIKQIHLVLAGIVIVGVLAVVSLTSSTAQVGASGKPTKVAVCSLVEIMPKFKLSEDLSDKFKNRQDEYIAEKKKRMEAANTAQKALAGLKPDSPAYNDELKRLRREIIELKVWGELEEQSIQADHLRQMELVVNKIKDGIATVAKQHGIDIVIQKSAPITQNRSLQEWTTNVMMDKVLYNGPQEDITEAVLQHLNENYRIAE
ncbi:MAG: OmpH family outer membrane protein [Phycisphaerae bacterium]|nr:OmpH family outer membrane protein [Phycisphaerae bacterium]